MNAHITNSRGPGHGRTPAGAGGDRVHPELRTPRGGEGPGGGLGPALGKNLAAWAFALLALFAMGAAAAPIVIEPDDYAPGTDLSNVSPHVTLQYRLGGEEPPAPVYASPPRGPFAAPTGSLTFGHFAFGFYDSVDLDGVIGFAILFHQPFAIVTLRAQNWGYCEFDDDGRLIGDIGGGLGAEWSAFDTAGQLIAYGYAGPGRCGRPFTVRVMVEDMAALVVGGAAIQNHIELDRLTLQVVEPATAALLGLGLTGLAWVGRRRQSPGGSS